MGAYDEPFGEPRPTDAPFPVINEQPTLGATFRNLYFSDYLLFAGMSLVGAVAGFTGGACAAACAGAA